MNLIDDDTLFGRIAAEEERDTLQSYFQETQAFKSVHQGSKWLVLGRKGSGKTAIFYYLERELKKGGARVASLTLNDYPLSSLSDLKLHSVDETEAHVQTWVFALLVTFMGLYLDAVKNLSVNDPNIRVYRAFCKQNEIEISANAMRSLMDTIKSIDHFDFSAFGVGAGVGLAQDTVSRHNFGDYAHKINAKLIGILQESLRTFLPNGRLVIQLDRLDEQWRNDSSSNALLIGLLKASRELNRELPGCRIIVFLRTDIFEVLHYQNRAHITEFIQRIDWRQEDLERVIALRISSKLPSGSATPSGDFTKNMWSLVFDIDIKYLAPKGAGQSIFRFFRVNSFLRPRDYIQLAKCLQQVAMQYGQQRISPKITQGEKPILLARLAEEEYSRRIFHEFQDELMDTLPRFPEIMDRLSQDIRYYVFSARQLRGVIEKAQIETSIDAAMRVLFECSVLGVDSQGGTRRDRGPGGRAGEYRYQSEVVRFDGASHFKVHPSLRSVLSLRTRTKQKSRDGILARDTNIGSRTRSIRRTRKRGSGSVPSLKTLPLWESLEGSGSG